MSIQGSLLSLPVRPDRRGTLATEADRARIVEQSILDFVQTRRGERVMLPEYGIRDHVFDVAGFGFAARLAYDLERVKSYEPLIETIRVRAGELIDERFSATPLAGDEDRAAVEVRYTVRGSNLPHNLVFPTWRLRSGD